MSRKLMAALLSTTLVLGGVSTSAWAAPDANQAQSGQAQNQAPLPPAGAAGIKQAQGFIEEFPILTLAVIGGVIALVWVLLDDNDDDEEAPSTTGT